MDQAILIDTGGVDCCCDPPPVFFVCPVEGSDDEQSCPDQIGPPSGVYKSGIPPELVFLIEWVYTEPMCKQNGVNYFMSAVCSNVPALPSVIGSITLTVLAHPNPDTVGDMTFQDIPAVDGFSVICSGTEYIAGQGGDLASFVHDVTGCVPGGTWNATPQCECPPQPQCSGGLCHFDISVNF